MPGAFNIKVSTEGVERVVAALRARSRASSLVANEKVIVGYDCPYAVYVHENLAAHHDTGQAKFLETPARTMKAQLSQIAYDVLRSGGTIAEAELAAGQALLQASKLLVPVKTGRLRDSGFVRVE